MLRAGTGEGSGKRSTLGAAMASPARTARRNPARTAARIVAGAVALAALSLPIAARAGPQGPSLPPEWKYVYEDQDAAAEALLAPLLKKYDTPAKCGDLVKALRGKRSYPSGLPDAQTLDFACSDGKTRQFTYLLPRKMNPRKPTGVVVFLHGAISQPAPGGGAGEARLFAPAFESLGLIVVGPSTYEKVEWGDPACRGLLRHALDLVKRHFNVDENRVYLAGDSDGGRGTYAIPETEGTFYAAAVPVIGSPGGTTRFANLRNLPWLAINGAKDSLFTEEHVRQAVEGMKEAGIDLTWRLLPDKGHDPRLILELKDEVCEFLAKHPRDPCPEALDWEVDPSAKGVETDAVARGFRWLRIERTGEAQSNAAFEDAGKGLLRGGLPRVRARREGNRIDVETSGVQAYTVLLSDAMVDLSKEVEIRTNGNASFKGPVAPDARAILEEARRFRDRALVFSARVTVEVDAAK